MRVLPVHVRGGIITPARSRVGASALLLAACAGAAPAFAQAQRGRHIDVSASARLQYDSNVVLSDRRLSGGGAEGDASVAPSLDLDIYLPRATGDFTLSGSLGYNFYRRFTRLNREQLDLRAAANQRVLSDCIVHGEAAYSRQLSDIGNVLTTAPADSINNTQEVRDYGADIGCGGSIGLRPSVAVHRTEIRNTTALRKLSDADTTSLTGQIGYGSPALGTVSVFGRYSDSDYVNRPTPSGKSDGTRVYSAGLQLERSMGTRLNLTGSVSYVQLDPKLAGASGFKGVGFDLSAQYNGDIVQVGLSGSRNAGPSQVIFASYEISTAVGLTLGTQITPLIGWNGGFTYQRRALQPSPLFAGLLELGADNIYTLSTGLTYHAGRRLRFRLDASEVKRTSTTNLIDYSATRVSLTTSLSL